MIYKNPEDDGGFPESTKYNLCEEIGMYNTHYNSSPAPAFYKALGIAVLLAVTGLTATACSKKQEGSITHRENQVLNSYNEQLKRVGEWPFNVRQDLLAVATNRTTPAKAGFFCDARDVVLAGEYRVKEFNASRSVKILSPSDIYLQMYGETVERSCGIIDIRKKDKPETPADFKEVQDVVRGDKLTPEMYDKMIQSANYCARSKQFMMEKTKNKGLLTTEDYDGLMDTVLECKRFELEQTLQQG